MADAAIKLILVDEGGAAPEQQRPPTPPTKPANGPPVQPSGGPVAAPEASAAEPERDSRQSAPTSRKSAPAADSGRPSASRGEITPRQAITTFAEDLLRHSGTFGLSRHIEQFLAILRDFARLVSVFSRRSLSLSGSIADLFRGRGPARGPSAETGPPPVSVPTPPPEPPVVAPPVQRQNDINGPLAPADNRAQGPPPAQPPQPPVQPAGGPPQPAEPPLAPTTTTGPPAAEPPLAPAGPSTPTPQPVIDAQIVPPVRPTAGPTPAATAGGTGGLAAAVGPAVVAIGAVAAVAALCAVALKKFGDMVQNQAQKLEAYSVEVSLATARTAVMRERMAFARAERIGPDVAKWERIRSNAEEQLQRVGTEILKVVLNIFETFEPEIKALVELLKILPPAVEVGGKQLEILVDFATTDVAELLKDAKEVPGLIQKLMTAVKTAVDNINKPPEDQPPFNDPFLQDFFLIGQNMPGPPRPPGRRPRR